MRLLLRPVSHFKRIYKPFGNSGIKPTLEPFAARRFIIHTVIEIFIQLSTMKSHRLSYLQNKTDHTYLLSPQTSLVIHKVSGRVKPH